MKKLLILLLFIPLVSFGQSQIVNGIEISAPKEYVKTGNLTWSKGNNTFIVQSVDVVAIKVEEIKKCDYVGIEKFDKGYNKADYVTYNCNEDIDGKIGFMITNRNGYIRYFPNKE